MRENIRRHIDMLIDGSTPRQWQKESLRHIVKVGRDEPEILASLVEEALQRVPEGGGYIDIVLAFLPQTFWPKLAALSVDRLAWIAGSEVAVRVVRQAGLQFPAVLHARLESVFRIERKNGDGFEASFRQADLESVRFLFARATSRHKADRHLACRALLETRLPEALSFASLQIEGYSAYLPEIGFEETAAGFRRLYTERVLHLAFPPDYLDRLSQEVTQRNVEMSHPTWEPAPRGARRHHLGGESAAECPICSRRVPRLLVLDPVPSGIGVSGLDRLELVACLSCLGWERKLLHYQHEDGSARALSPSDDDDAPPSEPRVCFGPPRSKRVQGGILAACKVALVDLGPRWRFQDWCGRENLNRVGGHPIWIEGAAYPSCPGCGATSVVLMQIDSELLTTDDRAWLWGQGGICYVLWCDRCRISTVFWQCL
jgi:hypothetical protein